MIANGCNQFKPSQDALANVVKLQGQQSFGKAVCPLEQGQTCTVASLFWGPQAGRTAPAIWSRNAAQAGSTVACEQLVIQTVLTEEPQVNLNVCT